MSPISSVRPTRLSKPFLIAFFFFLQSLFISSSFGQEILTPRDLPQDLIRRIEEVVDSFKKPIEAEEFRDIVSRPKKDALQALDYEEECSEGNGDIYYFFSFSMPEEVILQVMKDAVSINRKGEERVSLVLRGFISNDLKTTISHLYKYLLKVGDDLPIEVDPELFESFGIRAVPQIIKTDGEKKGVIKGDLISLSHAISLFREELKDYGVFGRLYSIGEEDILKVFASKQKQIEEDLRRRLPEIRERMLVLKRYDGSFEHAREDRVYYINPKVILTEDIVDLEGNVLIPQGTVFDPTQYVTLGRYVVIDGNSEKQVEFALKGDFKKIILISGNLEKLVKTHRRPFYFANDELLERFRIKRVPAVIEGDGEYVRVTEKALD
jgi:conjugal transfer pilus assembly protein TraW